MIQDTAQQPAGLRVGYARVSTGDQSLDLQIDALKKSGVDHTQIYADTASGSSTDRSELAGCLRALRRGDTLVVWRLDRLGRSTQDLIRIVGDLETRGIAFESLTEKIDTASATGKLVFHVFSALAEFERNLIRERTLAGLAAARARGRRGGPKRKLSDKQALEVKALMAAGTLSPDRIAEMYGVSRTTVYNVSRDSYVVKEGSSQKTENKAR